MGKESLTFPFEFDASKMKKGMNVRLGGYQEPIYPTDDQLIEYDPYEDYGEDPQKIESLHASSRKTRKRPTKEEQNKLMELMSGLLREGYDFSSIQIILRIRKDRIANCLADIFSDHQSHSDFMLNRQILPASKLRGLNGADKSDYWEAVRMPNGAINLIPVNLSFIRKRYGIDN